MSEKMSAPDSDVIRIAKEEAKRKNDKIKKEMEKHFPDADSKGYKRPKNALVDDTNAAAIGGFDRGDDAGGYKRPENSLVDDTNAAAIGGFDRDGNANSDSGYKRPENALVDDTNAAAIGGFDNNQTNEGYKRPENDLVDEPNAAAIGGFDNNGSELKNTKSEDAIKKGETLGLRDDEEDRLDRAIREKGDKKLGKEFAGLRDDEEDRLDKEIKKRENDKLGKEFLGLRNDEEDRLEKEINRRKESGAEKLTPEEIREIFKKDVEDARAEYARQDYEANKKQSMFKRVLGLSKDTMTFDEVRNAYEKYQKASRALADHEIAEAKAMNLDGADFDKRAQDILKCFDLDEKTNLWQARTDARTKAWEGTKWGKLIEWSNKATGAYNKLPKKYKYAIAGALFVGGGGLAAAAGLAGVSAAGLGVFSTSMFSSGAGLAFITTFRAFSGSAAGAGMTLGMEAKDRVKQEKQAEEKNAGSIEQLNAVEAEQKFDALSKMLDIEMNTYHSSLQKEKSRDKNRKLIGAGVGVFFGSGAAGILLGKLSHGIGHAAHEIGNWSDKLRGLFGGAVKVDPGTFSAHGGVELSSMHGHAPHFTVEKGSSLEGSIIKYLKSTGIGAEDAGSKAHRMVLEYAKLNGAAGADDFSLIHPGASVTLVPGGSDGFHLVEAFDEKGIGNLHHLKGALGGVTEHAGKMAEATIPSAEDANFAFGGNEVAAPTIPSAEDAHFAFGGNEIDSSVAHIDTSSDAFQHSDLATDHGIDTVHPAAALAGQANEALSKGFEEGRWADGIDPTDADSYEAYMDNVRERAQEVAEKSAEIFARHPEFTNITDYDNAIRLLENETGPHWGQRAIDLQALNELRDTFSGFYKKTLEALVGPNFNDKLFDMNAAEYVATHGQGNDNLVGALKSFKGVLTPEEFRAAGLDPKSNETVAKWADRLTKFTLGKLNK